MLFIQKGTTMVKDPLRVAAVQFEMAENNKDANKAKMVAFIKQAAEQKADVITFPEMCLNGYHYLTQSPKDKLLAMAENAKTGPSVRFFKKQARKYSITILFGLLELGKGEEMYNTYVVITPEKGVIFKYRKIHAFENSAILAGHKLDTFEIHGWRCGILICYDNNLPENSRVLKIKGAEIIFAPHQTGGFDIPCAGMGRIPLGFWHNRKTNPAPMDEAIRGPKGRAWITKWLPTRSYDNSLFTVFANGVGIDGPEVRTGNSMIIDPEGIIKAETMKVDDDMIMADLSRKELENTLGGSHFIARKPSLYKPISAKAEEVDTRLIRNKISNEKII